MKCMFDVCFNCLKKDVPCCARQQSVFEQEDRAYVYMLDDMACMHLVQTAGLMCAMQRPSICGILHISLRCHRRSPCILASQADIEPQIRELLCPLRLYDSRYLRLASVLVASPWLLMRCRSEPVCLYAIDWQMRMST